jgi:hypothetical protein
VDDRDENDNGLFRLSENISFFSDILKNSFDKGCFFKFGVEVGVGESIEIAPLV